MHALARHYCGSQVGDPIGDIIAPLVFLAFVMASWVLQPERKGSKEREASADRYASAERFAPA